jgi:hypothetical protein
MNLIVLPDAAYADLVARGLHDSGALVLVSESELAEAMKLSGDSREALVARVGAYTTDDPDVWVEVPGSGENLLQYVHTDWSEWADDDAYREAQGLPRVPYGTGWEEALTDGPITSGPASGDPA